MRDAKDLGSIDAGVPDLQFRHDRTLRQALAVRVRRGANGFSRAPLARAGRARRDVNARRQALDVPLPRSRKRLVEVVDVEDDVAFGRRKNAEILDVAVAAGLHDDARDPVAGAEIVGHDARRTAKERERRPAHASVANRHQVRDASFVRGCKQCERVGAVVSGRPLAVARPRAIRTESLALSQECANRKAAVRGRVHSSSVSASSSWERRSCSKR